MFAKVFVINLRFKTDRLAEFRTAVPACLGHVEVWPAVHGDTVQHPDWWTSGRGAWGCYRSHLQILEHCYNAGIESYIVFEDDAIFRSSFEFELTTFMRHVPPDWEQIYLGGQLLHEVSHPPEIVNEHVLIPFNVNRTHCFAVHRRGYQRLYRHLHNTPFVHGEHIDHHLGRLHETGDLHIYVPPRWLVGQNAGPSNISGHHNTATFWHDPETLVDRNQTAISKTLPAIFLEAPIEVAVELEKRGWHRGHWQNEHHLDRGVCEAVSSIDCRNGLRKWHKAVSREGIREGAKCLCLFHPSLSWSCVSTLDFSKFVHIRATTADEAEQALAAGVHE